MTAKAPENGRCYGGRRRPAVRIVPLVRPWSFKLIQNLSHLQRQFCLRDWLLQQVDTFIKPSLMDHGITRIARHVQDLQSRSNLMRAPAEFATIDPRHDHVSEKKVHLRVVLQENGQSG